MYGNCLLSNLSLTLWSVFLLSVSVALWSGSHPPPTFPQPRKTHFCGLLFFLKCVCVYSNFYCFYLFSLFCCFWFFFFWWLDLFRLFLFVLFLFHFVYFFILFTFLLGFFSCFLYVCLCSKVCDKWRFLLSPVCRNCFQVSWLLEQTSSFCGVWPSLLPSTSRCFLLKRPRQPVGLTCDWMLFELCLSLIHG